MPFPNLLLSIGLGPSELLPFLQEPVGPGAEGRGSWPDARGLQGGGGGCSPWRRRGLDRRPRCRLRVRAAQGSGYSRGSRGSLCLPCGRQDASAHGGVVPHRVGGRGFAQVQQPP